VVESSPAVRKQAELLRMALLHPPGTQNKQYFGLQLSKIGRLQLSFQ
jgi:hypothetical protein